MHRRLSIISHHSTQQHTWISLIPAGKLASLCPWGVANGGLVTGSLVDTCYDVTLCVTFRLAVLGSAQLAPGRSVGNMQPAHCTGNPRKKFLFGFATFCVV